MIVMTEERRAGVMWPGETKVRKVRVSDALWEACQARAEREGTTVSDVIRAALAAYAGDPGLLMTEGSKHNPYG